MIIAHAHAVEKKQSYRFRFIAFRRLAFVALAVLAACDSSGGGFEKPDVGKTPSSPITIQLTNTLSENLFVPWSIENDASLPVFSIERGTHSLSTLRSCYPDCVDACECKPCDTVSDVRVVPPEAVISVRWKPVHYVINKCHNSADCGCAESWPLTVGHYRMTLTAFSQAIGGIPQDDEPDFLRDAMPGPESVSCDASAEFDIAARKATIDAVFRCNHY